MQKLEEKQQQQQNLIITTATTETKKNKMCQPEKEEDSSPSSTRTASTTTSSTSSSSSSSSPPHYTGGTITLGIAGGSGSGKTTLAKALSEALGGDESAVYLAHDDYYKDLSHLPPEERARTNFDHPSSLDTELMIQHIRTLREGKAIEVPKYCFQTHSRLKNVSRKVLPQKIVIVEGILILTNSELRSEMNLMVYVDADSDVRLSRRMLRDIKERGRSLDDVISQYHATVRPMHEEWVEPSKKYADFVVQTNQHSLTIAVKTLTNHLRAEAAALVVSSESTTTSTSTNDNTNVTETTTTKSTVKVIEDDEEANSNASSSTTTAIDEKVSPQKTKSKKSLLKKRFSSFLKKKKSTTTRNPVQ